VGVGFGVLIVVAGFSSFGGIGVARTGACAILAGFWACVVGLAAGAPG
jgi:hypothetical protein